MIPIAMKKDMVMLLGRVIRGQIFREEGVEENWNKLSFEEKMNFAESVLESAIQMPEAT